MKNIFIALIISVLNFSAYACTDFTGKFYNSEDEDENNTFEMFQNGCESIDLGDGMIFDFDGKDKLFIQMGDSKVYVNNRLEGEKWILLAKTVTPLSNGTEEVDTIISERTLNADLDIIDHLHYADGSAPPWTRIIKRVSSESILK
jgi:hypothetical protein